MPISQVQIWNMALGQIGHSDFIMNPSENSKAANVCRTYWDTVRDSCLESFDWPFARAYKALAEAAGDYLTGNWQRAYLLPSDYIAARAVVEEGRTTMARVDQRIAYSITGEGDTKVMLTDYQNPVLRYTRRVTDPNMYSPSFAALLSAALAVELAMPMSVSATIAQAAAQKQQRAYSHAVTVALQLEVDQNPPESEFIAARK